MSQVRICHISTVHQYNDTRIFLKECSSLAANGYETHLIALNAPEEEKQCVLFHRIPEKINKGRLFRFTHSVFHAYKLSINVNALIYHFHDFELIPTALLLKIKGKKVIYDSHEDLPRQIMSKNWIPRLLRPIISIIIEIIENISVHFLDAVICATPFIYRRFNKKHNNSVNINNYSLQDELILKKTQTSEAMRVACYVGSISKIRGIYEMVRAIQLTDFRLYLAGAFQDDKLRNDLKQIEGWRQVIEFGHVSRQKFAEIISQSMCGLILYHPEPNHIHSQPNKLFEYMSAGLPVVAAHFPLWRAIIEESECGICVDPVNIEQIAAAIEWIGRNPKKSKQMGENGRHAVIEKYNWKNEERKLLKLYKDILTK